MRVRSAARMPRPWSRTARIASAPAPAARLGPRPPGRPRDFAARGRVLHGVPEQVHQNLLKAERIAASGEGVRYRAVDSMATRGEVGPCGEARDHRSGELG